MDYPSEGHFQQQGLVWVGIALEDNLSSIGEINIVPIC